MPTPPPPACGAESPVTPVTMTAGRRYLRRFQCVCPCSRKGLPTGGAPGCRHLREPTPSSVPRALVNAWQAPLAGPSPKKGSIDRTPQNQPGNIQGFNGLGGAGAGRRGNTNVGPGGGLGQTLALTKTEYRDRGPERCSLKIMHPTDRKPPTLSAPYPLSLLVPVFVSSHGHPASVPDWPIFMPFGDICRANTGWPRAQNEQKKNVFEHPKGLAIILRPLCTLLNEKKKADFQTFLELLGVSQWSPRAQDGIKYLFGIDGLCPFWKPAFLSRFGPCFWSQNGPF